ncbi:carboxymuconolactone decarboxylase family protein [bacterium]|nr:carboxymuconolactone decarboxylase family protein [bacterium]
MNRRLESIEILLENNPEEAELILLGTLSVCWLQPQNPDAAELLRHYERLNLSMDALREAALQLFLVAGFQVSLEAFFQMEDVLQTKLTSTREPIQDKSATRWHERGLELQNKVYASNTTKLRQNLERHSPELADWTVLVGYGLVLSRPGLEAGLRELLEVAVLTANGFPRQLHSHFRGALNLGVTSKRVELLLDAIEPFVAEDKILSARQLWKQIRR